ncbi:cysteine desulfurase family protein [Enterovirga aerilata]|uniref:Cysteine desulfurase n=1 Tax=Enterovirga aerilata TaxID=2730920 RepID=A0A849I7R5_9HYPH|nr:cysteine desulfurase family protein [Enterovirga sp. DB1703]NNM72449.1 cysteine desulfurase [Enterovirga sp. DB1703]
MRPIYLDHNGTTPVDPEVLEAMLPYLRAEYGNASTTHPLGQRARRAVERAREQVASLIGAEPGEVVFTSGGTEASNMAIRGAAALRPERSGIVTTAIEHPATEECCSLLERGGRRVTRARASSDGRVAAEAMTSAIGPETALVTIIHAQNEIGTLQPVAEVARGAHAVGALVHADTAQSVGKVPVDVRALGVDLLSIAGHKLYAPKGIGALYTRAGIELPPLLVGAGQERGRRPGTENVAFIAGLGEACRIAMSRLSEDAERMRRLAQALLDALRQAVPDLLLVGEAAERLPNTLNVIFPNVSGRQLLESCPAVIASNGSACHAGDETPSAILTALGLPSDQALGAVRLSLGRTSSPEEVAAAAAALASTWSRLAAHPAVAVA